MTAYVYLIPHTSDSRLKIGKAVDVIARARQLGMEQLCLSGATFIKLADEDAALGFEKTLHRSFSRWSIDPKQINPDGHRHDGDTEWFSLDCQSRLMNYVSSNIDLFDANILDESDKKALIDAAHRALPKRAKGTPKKPIVELTVDEINEISRNALDSVARQLTSLAKSSREIRLAGASVPNQMAVVGIALRGEEPRVKSLLESLFTDHDLKINRSFGRFVSSYDTIDNQEFTYRLTLAWPDPERQAEHMIDEILGRIQNYPIPISGWGTEASVM
jgi:hypothetical protein